jgi:hypothetical protein
MRTLFAKDSNSRLYCCAAIQLLALIEYYAVFRPTLVEECRAFDGIVLIPRF